MTNSFSTASSGCRQGLGLAAAALAVGLGGVIRAADSPAPAEAPKTHVMFMGADIELSQGKELHRVEEVTASALVIKPGGQRVEVPLNRQGDLLIKESLKIASANATVAHLEADRAYTAGADPFRLIVQGVALAAGQSAATDLADANARNLETLAAGGPPSESVTRALEDARGQVDRNALESTREINNPSSQSVKAGTEGMRELFDAIRLSFEVTVDQDLAKSCFIVIAEIRDADSKPGQIRKWAYVKFLGELKAGEPKNVRIYQGGFPPGYVLEACEVHLYNRGEELATNLSRKRVALTDDEAREYRVIEYIGVNKGRSLAAVPITKTFTRDIRATLSPAQCTGSRFVRVARDGRVIAAYLDADGKLPLGDPLLEAALKSLYFNPALLSGKPIEATVPVNLEQLAARVD